MAVTYVCPDCNQPHQSYTKDWAGAKLCYMCHTKRLQLGDFREEKDITDKVEVIYENKDSEGS